MQQWRPQAPQEIGPTVRAIHAEKTASFLIDENR